MNVSAQSGMFSDHAVSAAHFRSACGLFVRRDGGDPTLAGRGALWDDGEFVYFGFLRSAFILVCIDSKARFLRELAADEPFAVNILSERQQHLAMRFPTGRKTIVFPAWNGRLVGRGCRCCMVWW